MLKYEKAVIMAATAHKGQIRKGSGEPYIIHPFTVAMTLIDEGCNEEVVIAGLLHDTVEDAEITFLNIEEKFGKEVTRLVRGATEVDKSLPWEERKNHTINYIKKAPLDERLLICADKLHNINSMIDDYEKIGEKLWQKFNGNKEQQKWYYTKILESFNSFDDIPSKITIFDRLEKAVNEFF
ncbi:MAG: HD domain-containing protein [Halanaerobiales bacterium]